MLSKVALFIVLLELREAIVWVIISDGGVFPSFILLPFSLQSLSDCVARR